MGLLTQGAEQFTGTATYVRALLLEFGRRTDQVRLEVLCNEPALRIFASCASPSVVLKPAQLASGTARGQRAVALAGARLRPRRLQQQLRDAQVVHYPLTLGVPPVRLPTMLSLHDVQHHDMPQYFSRAALLWRRAFYDGPARSATLIHTLSGFSKARIVDRLHVDPDRVVVIPLAVDPTRFRPQADPDEAQLVQPLGLPPRFLFYPATLWHHKHHLELLDAMTLVEDDELHLVLCGGSFGRRGEILAAAADRGLAARVHHLGFIADAALPAVYRRATALVFPSTYEGFGTPPLEAMASGCPAASSLAGSLAEVCGEAVLPLAPNDPRQMATAIDRLANDKTLRARLRKAGLERAAGFAWHHVADAHLNAYRRAAGMPDPPSRIRARSS